MFKIIKGVPIPPFHQGAKLKYPWDEMKVGDSIRVPKSRTRSPARCAHSYGDRHNEYRFVTRTVGVESETQIWRVPLLKRNQRV